MHKDFIYNIPTIITPSNSFHVPRCLKFMTWSLMIVTCICTYMCVTMDTHVYK